MTKTSLCSKNRLAGKKLSRDIEIVYTGLRPGEKLTEELFHENEPLTGTSVAGLHRAASRPVNLAQLKDQIERLCNAAAAGDSSRTFAEISSIVTEFQGRTSASDAETTRRAIQ